jgi:hypothetical protein
VKKLFAFLASFALVGAFAIPAASGSEEKITQRTLASFSSSSTSLNNQHRSQIRAVVQENPDAEKFICTGIRLAGATTAENLRVRSRAKAACDYAKSLNPALSTWFQSKVTRATSYAGKVLLTVKSARVTAAPAVTLIEKVPAQKTLTSLASHIKALEFRASRITPLKLEYQIGPTADPVRVKKVIDSFANKLRLYQLLGLKGLDMDWVLVSENDYEWWREYRLSQEANYPVELWDKAKNELGHCGLSSDVFCGAGTGVNGKNYQDNVVGTRFTDRALDYVAQHEAAHFYQAVFGYGGRCWFAEGQATFFETYLENSSRSRSQVINTFKASPSKTAQLSEAELIARLQNNSVCDQDYRVAYDMGMLAFEYLYMNYSLKQVHDLMVLSSNTPWSRAVPEVLGVGANELDAAIGRYVHANVN